MTKNDKILKLGIILIAVALIISLGLSIYLKLDKPVFIKSYMELGLPVLENGDFGLVHFSLNYITNANDTKLVNHIEIKDLETNYINASEVDRGGYFAFEHNVASIQGQTIGRYSIRTIYVTIDAFELDNTKDEFQLTMAKVYFNDGTHMDVDLGKVILYRHDNSKARLDFNSFLSSSDGTSNSRGITEVDITLLSVVSPILEVAKDYIEFKINGIDYKDIQGLTINSGESISVDTKFSIPDDIELKMSQIVVDPKLTYRDMEGNEYTYRFHNVDYRRYRPELKDLIQFLQSRGDI